MSIDMVKEKHTKDDFFLVMLALVTACIDFLKVLKEQGEVYARAGHSNLLHL